MGSGITENALGLVAAILSSVAAAPQLYKVMTPNTTQDLSFWTILIHFIAAILWAVYGFLIESFILFIECILVALLYVLILLAMFRDWRLNQAIRGPSDLPNDSIVERQV